MAVSAQEVDELRAKLAKSEAYAERLRDRLWRLERWEDVPGSELDREWPYKRAIFEHFRPSVVTLPKPREDPMRGVQVYPPLATDAEPLAQELYTKAWTRRADGRPDEEGTPAELWSTTRISRVQVKCYVGGLAKLRADVEVDALHYVHHMAHEARRVVYRVDFRWLDYHADPVDEWREESAVADVLP